MKLVSTYFLCCLVFTVSKAQNLSTNLCDSTILNKEELKKCKIDSVWAMDIVIKINYISAFKTQVLPKYRWQRQKIQLSEKARLLVQKLKQTYDSTLNYKLSVWEYDMDKNQKYVQPKAYVSSLLSFQLFRFYPDVYAILLNEVHLDLNPKTAKEQIDKIKNLCNNILKEMPSSHFDQLKRIVELFQADRLKLSDGINMELFQEEKKSEGYNIINFLLWME